MIRSLDGKTPRIHPSVFVSEGAYIVGDVEIGENSNIWPGAVIRGDYGRIVIGANCSIQDNCVLHAEGYMELGDNVVMAHGAVVHGGQLGQHVLLGVNAVVLDNARIGSFCLIGAGVIVRSGFHIPDHSLVVALPGKVLPLSKEQEAQLLMAPAKYAQNGRRFLQEGLGTPIPNTTSEVHHDHQPTNPAAPALDRSACPGRHPHRRWTVLRHDPGGHGRRGHQAGAAQDRRPGQG
ncbi:MAG: gamma carbonic anhydrase family protein [SAR202 cluster bacterium]|nr:gamma carbonic anhydrase family protein [SAR202 cluster bacterium]